MRPDAPIAWLRSARAFRVVSESGLRRLYAQCHAQVVAAGEALFEAGDPADALHLVLTGRIAVIRNGEQALYSELGPKAVLDEIAFFARRRHDDSAVAARDSVVLRLDWADFRDLADHLPELWQGVTEGLAVMADAGVPMASMAVGARFDRPRTLTICPAGGTELPRSFLDRLAETLDGHAECQFLTSEGLGQDLPGGIALEDPQVLHWLQEQESRFDLVVCLTDAEPTEWTRKALAQADEILLAGVHDGNGLGPPVRVTANEALAFDLRGPKACRLALIHDRGGEGPRAGARRWLEYRQPRSHHHVDLNDMRSYQRLVRFLLGRAVGFAASGSGVYSAANLGLVKALRASGITIDCFGGTGGGAALAAWLAMGLDPDDIDDMAATIMAERRALQRRTWPRFSLYDHRAFDRLVIRRFPDVDIADLPYPYYALSANLSTSTPFVHSRGNAQSVIRANWPFPGLLVPFISDEGEWLADGGILAAEPSAPMRGLKNGPNFVAHIAPPPLGPAPVSYREIPSRLRLLGKLLRPRGRSTLPRLPSLEGQIVRCYGANGVTPPPGATEDLVLAPPMPDGLDVLAWSEHGRVKDTAYRWGIEELERLGEEGHALLLAAVGKGGETDG